MKQFLLLSLAVCVWAACGRTNAEDSALAGAWIARDGMYDGVRSVFIRETDEAAWIVEDEDGRYPATWEGGILKLSGPWRGEAAIVYDPEANALIVRVTGPRRSVELEFDKAECEASGVYLVEGVEQGELILQSDCRFEIDTADRDDHGVFTDDDTVLMLYGGDIHVQEATIEGRRIVLDDPTYLMSPTRRRYVSAMKSDLRNLQSAEEIYFSTQYSYITDATIEPGQVHRELQFLPSEGVTISITSARGGYRATATHTGTDVECVAVTGDNYSPITCR